MNVILLQKINRLGELGDEVNVAAGYARNYLIPKDIAVPATSANRVHFEARRAELEKAAIATLSAAEQRAEQLNLLPQLTIKSQAGEGGKLFGSIGVRDIAAAISEAGVTIEKNEIRLPDGPLRQVGEYEITVQLHGQTQATVNICVVAEEAH